MTSITFDQSTETPFARLVAGMRNGNSALWWTAIAMTALSIACVALQFVDAREIHGANVWHKPAKFFFSIAVHVATVSWAISLMPLAGKGVKRAAAILATAGWIELAYIAARAARGEASHFNVGTPLDSALYAAMGFGAVSMTAATAYIGWQLWRNRRDGLWSEAAAAGLMLGAVLGTLAGGYLSSQTGHWVGGDMTDATGTGFFGWSTTGGDLRVAHFAGLHALQIVPLAALTGRRSIVWITAALITIGTAATFLLALSGVPLFRV
jgi:hypothetical protein